MFLPICAASCHFQGTPIIEMSRYRTAHDDDPAQLECGIFRSNAIFPSNNRRMVPMKSRNERICFR